MHAVELTALPRPSNWISGMGRYGKKNGCRIGKEIEIGKCQATR